MSLIERSLPREIKFTTNINPYAAGSVIAEFGNTKVHVTAVVEEKVPSWMKGNGTGWVTAEYSMLPSATHSRSRRERSKVGGRTYEIQRLIGRSLRSIIDLDKLGEVSIMIDCDVLVADGGTRTTSISGAYVALQMAVKKLIADGVISENPIHDQLGAISVGVNTDGKVIADLNYEEDSSCETDMNIVMTKAGEFVEIQGTAEERPFNRNQLNGLLEAAEESLKVVFAKQDEVLGSL
jgi:ribonuclease PH